MTWLTWLTLAVILTAIAAVTGLKPRGSKHVSGTHLMGVARAVLVVVVLVLLYLAFSARTGG